MWCTNYTLVPKWGITKQLVKMEYHERNAHSDQRSKRGDL